MEQPQQEQPTDQHSDRHPKMNVGEYLGHAAARNFGLRHAEADSRSIILRSSLRAAGKLFHTEEKMGVAGVQAAC